MEISLNTRKAYSEIDEFLSLLKEEQRNKIPQKLREFFNEEKDKQYTKGISVDKDIKSQNLMEETLAIIALLNLQYWCEDEAEKQRLKDVYAKNEKLWQDAFQIKFDSNEIFKKNVVVTKQQEETNTQMVEYKESVINRLIKKIKKLFGIKK